MLITGTPAIPAGYVTRVGTKLYLDGAPYRFTGMNVYQLNTITMTAADLAAMQGAKGLRSWFSQQLGVTGGVLDWTAFDRTLALVKAAHMKIIVTLGNNSPVYENCAQPQTTLSVASGVAPGTTALTVAAVTYDWQTGVDALLKSGTNVQRATLSAQTNAGGTTLTVNPFTPGFNFPIGTTVYSGNGYKDITWYQTGYKNTIFPGWPYDDILTYREWALSVVTRYKDHPEILMWQLINEAEASDYHGGDNYGGCTYPAAPDALAAFADDMGGRIKSIDPYHLVSLGTLGGNHCGYADFNYRTIHASPYIDLCEYHDYGDITYAMPGDAVNGMQRRINQAGALNKPLFVGECGILAGDLTGSSVASYATRKAQMDAKMSAQFAAGVQGWLMWNYRDAAHGGSNVGRDDYDIGPADPAIALLAKYA